MKINSLIFKKIAAFTIAELVITTSVLIAICAIIPQISLKKVNFLGNPFEEIHFISILGTPLRE